MSNTVEGEKPFENVQHSENTYVEREHHSNDLIVEGRSKMGLYLIILMMFFMMLFTTF